MRTEHLEVLAEEPSMEAFLRNLLPKVLGEEIDFKIYAYQGKEDLLNKLLARLAGYAKWLPETYRILVIVDQDDGDCLALKEQMERAAVQAGLRSRHAGQVWQVVNRIAVEELEAWYFGDWAAVRAAYPRVPKTIPSSAKYRDPDAVRGGTWEAFERILRLTGYFSAGLRKIEAARAIAPHMLPERNCSRSFAALHSVLEEMVSA